jgi:hypothetical protein
LPSGGVTLAGEATSEVSHSARKGALAGAALGGEAAKEAPSEEVWRRHLADEELYQGGARQGASYPSPLEAYISSEVSPCGPCVVVVGRFNTTLEI